MPLIVHVVANRNNKFKLQNYFATRRTVFPFVCDSENQSFNQLNMHDTCFMHSKVKYTFRKFRITCDFFFFFYPRSESESICLNLALIISNKIYRHIN